jgi:hypothetical protein
MNGRPTNNTTVPGYSYSGTVTGWGGKWPDPPVLGEMPCTVDQPGQRCRQGSLAAVGVFDELTAQVLAKLNDGLRKVVVTAGDDPATQEAAWVQEGNKRFKAAGISAEVDLDPATRNPIYRRPGASVGLSLDGQQQIVQAGFAGALANGNGKWWLIGLGLLFAGGAAAYAWKIGKK